MFSVADLDVDLSGRRKVLGLQNNVAQLNTKDPRVFYGIIALGAILVFAILATVFFLALAAVAFPRTRNTIRELQMGTEEPEQDVLAQRLLRNFPLDKWYDTYRKTGEKGEGWQQLLEQVAGGPDGTVNEEELRQQLEDLWKITSSLADAEKTEPKDDSNSEEEKSLVRVSEKKPHVESSARASSEEVSENSPVSPASIPSVEVAEELDVVKPTFLSSSVEGGRPAPLPAPEMFRQQGFLAQRDRSGAQPKSRTGSRSHAIRMEHVETRCSYRGHWEGNVPGTTLQQDVLPQRTGSKASRHRKN